MASSREHDGEFRFQYNDGEFLLGRSKNFSILLQKKKKERDNMPLSWKERRVKWEKKKPEKERNEKEKKNGQRLVTKDKKGYVS